MTRQILRSALVSFALLAALFATPGVTMRSAPDELADLMKDVELRRDDVEPETLEKIAALKTRAAADALARAYDMMGSIYMRREVVRALARLDGVGEAEQTALQKVMDVATGAEEPELREAALDELGGASHLGKSFLEMVVESPADDQVRVKALELHVAQSVPADREWYKKLYDTERKAEPDKDKRRKKDEDEEAEKQLKVHRLASVREQAFDALRAEMSVDELIEACQDRWAGIRRMALESLLAKDPKRVEVFARDTFEDLEERAANRAVAARVLAELEGKKLAKEFIDVAEAFITPEELRMALGELLAGFDDERVNSTLLKMVGKGKHAYEKLWVLHAVRNIPDDKLYKSLVRMLGDKEVEVAIAAAAVLGERREAEALEALEKVVEKSKEPELVAEAIDAISLIREGDAEWTKQLVQYAEGEARDVRNGAIRRLGRTGDAAYVPVLAKALQHQDWSTRLAALNALALIGNKEAVGLIIARMPEETGRMSHEFADVLFELTGQPYRTASGNWKAWWEREKDGFVPISEGELAKRRAEEEERRLRQLTSTRFFGIRIESHRVVFIIDVSGSMNETMRARYVGETSNTTRIDVAKRELKKAVEGLDRNALFNILVFSSGVDSWIDGGVAGSTGKAREEAKEWVERLGAGGATNLYDAVQRAFEDPDVDTIFILSDGEPTAGAQVDPGTIRAHVQRWNENRGIVINSISIGLQLEVLKWLAEDSGGQYVQFF